jgi:hypothetical protein
MPFARNSLQHFVLFLKNKWKMSQCQAKSVSKIKKIHKRVSLVAETRQLTGAEWDTTLSLITEATTEKVLQFVMPLYVKGVCFVEQNVFVFSKSTKRLRLEKRSFK